MGIASKLTPQEGLVVLIRLIIIKFSEFQNLGEPGAYNSSILVDCHIKFTIVIFENDYPCTSKKLVSKIRFVLPPLIITDKLMRF